MSGGKSAKNFAMVIRDVKCPNLCIHTRSDYFPTASSHDIKTVQDFYDTCAAISGLDTLMSEQEISNVWIFVNVQMTNGKIVLDGNATSPRHLFEACAKNVHLADKGKVILFQAFSDITPSEAAAAAAAAAVQLPLLSIPNSFLCLSFHDGMQCENEEYSCLLKAFQTCLINAHETSDAETIMNFLGKIMARVSAQQTFFFTTGNKELCLN